MRQKLVRLIVCCDLIVHIDIAHANGFDKAESSFHFVHCPVKRACRLFGVAHYGNEKVGKAVINTEFNLFRVDKDKLYFIGRCLVEDGQKKTVDTAIIFGIFQNVIANVDFNVIFLDELFSNMDADIRNTMLRLIKENFEDDKSVFIMNNAEMDDEYFKHKIRVSLTNKKINVKQNG